MSKKILKVGTLFSGIGAFEEALKQMGIPHKILFACDNGEIELFPLEDKKERKEFEELEKNLETLDDKQKQRYQVLKAKVDAVVEEMRQTCFAMPSNQERTKYVNSVYKKFLPYKKNYMKISYLANHELNEEDFHTDVRFIKGDEYRGQIDILVGGSPCQSFSTYGKKRGLEDTRGTLFYDYARIIQECQPKIFIYENVNGLLSHDDGKTWEIMIEVWQSLGYNLSYKILNAEDYDFPQTRHRLFLVGIRNDVFNGKEYHFPKEKPLTKRSWDYLETEVDNSFYLPQKGFEWVTIHSKNVNRTRFNRDVIGAQTATQQDNWTGDLWVERPKQRHYDDPRIYKGKYDFGNGLEDAVARKMTPRECLNLMGFNSEFKAPVPKIWAYRQAGNSIVVPVLMEIIKTLKPYLK